MISFKSTQLYIDHRKYDWSWENQLFSYVNLLLDIIASHMPFHFIYAKQLKIAFLLFQMADSFPCEAYSYALCMYFRSFGIHYRYTSTNLGVHMTTYVFLYPLFCSVVQRVCGYVSGSQLHQDCNPPSASHLSHHPPFPHTCPFICT